jgi:hypothetical protein
MAVIRICLLIASLVLPLKTVLFAQSLADVARQEEERRKTIKKPSKVYTSEDLRRESGSAPTTVSVPTAASTPTTPSTASTPSTPSTPSSPAAENGSTSGGNSNANTTPESSSQGAKDKDQTYWKTRITQAREQLDRSKTLADAMQSRINALNTDFVNTDDPVKRGGVERDRQKARAELDRLKNEIKEATKAVADIEEEARRASVPPGWLR